MMVSDEELLVASVGDEESFAAFYRRHARPLAGFFMQRTGDPELAADLTAETFAAALASRRRFDPAKGPATGWLYGIARHKLARTLEHGRVEDRARRTLGMAPIVLDDEAIELVESSDGDVVQLLQRLPADQRAAIEARVVDEQEYEQIAAATRTSQAVIRKRVSRGLASLRRKLEGPTARPTSSTTSNMSCAGRTVATPGGARAQAVRPSGGCRAFPWPSSDRCSCSPRSPRWSW